MLVRLPSRRPSLTLPLALSRRLSAERLPPSAPDERALSRLALAPPPSRLPDDCAAPPAEPDCPAPAWPAPDWPPPLGAAWANWERSAVPAVAGNARPRTA